MDRYESSSDEEDMVLFYLLYRRRKTKKKQRRWWVHNILLWRKQYGEYHRLVKELELDGDKFQQYFRLSREQFTHVLSIVGPHVQKKHTNWRQTISSKERLALCLVSNSYRLFRAACQNQTKSILWRDSNPQSRATSVCRIHGAKKAIIDA